MWELNSIDEAAGVVGLALKVETRTIILAQGIQFNNLDMLKWPYDMVPDGFTTGFAKRHEKWPRSMRKRPPLSIAPTADGFEYTSAAQGVKFDVKIVSSKSDFRRGLLTCGVHVIYAGHSRYGRGACFGPLPRPGEDWENGALPSETGLFRMGFPFVGIPVSDVIRHGYTVDLVAAALPVSAWNSEPDLRQHLGDLTSMPAEKIHPLLPKFASNKDPKENWLCYRANEHGTMAYHVVVHAGWTNTVSAPSDLGATDLKCRVFCHFGCDSAKHFRPIVQNKAFKGWRKKNDERHSFFTTAIADAVTPVYWLYHLFTYPKPNAFQDWGPSLEYAVQNVNDDLIRDGKIFQIT